MRQRKDEAKKMENALWVRLNLFWVYLKLFYIKTHVGDLKVKTEEGKGSNFVIQLPIR
jgi:hypothetical protein